MDNNKDRELAQRDVRMIELLMLKMKINVIGMQLNNLELSEETLSFLHLFLDRFEDEIDSERIDIEFNKIVKDLEIEEKD